MVERRTENPQAQGRDLVFRFGEIKKQKHLVGKYAGWVFFREKRGEIMGRRLRFKTPEELEETWEMYKDDCDSQMVLTHDFSSKNSEFVSKELKRSITYTIDGFCVFAGIPRSAFYDTYAEKKRYSDIVTRMKEECEVDARKKFELQVIPSQLAGLWMSKYGYTTKQDTNISGSLDTDKTKLDDLIQQMRGGDG